MSRYCFISTTWLNALPRFHLSPIILQTRSPYGNRGSDPVRDLVIFEEAITIPNLGDCFALRCFQRLSIRNIVTRRCPWQDSRYARGSVIPVLSSSSP